MPWVEKKKLLHNRGTAKGQCVANATKPDPVARYETLRAAALGEPVPPEYRSGLVLFLRRGMWSWAQTVAEVTPEQSTRSPWTVSTAERKPIVQVFAAMALDSTCGRAQ